MVKRNRHIAKLQAGYLFPEINRRRREFAAKNPHAKIISLGIGDTTEPIPQPIVSSMSEAARALGTIDGYRGYGPEQGMESLRQKIAMRMYGGRVAAGDIFVSDGAKCDIARLLMLFGSSVTVAMQDPSYPVYIDGSVIAGLTDGGITLLPCTPENDFFPDLKRVPRTDLIYFCSPNNPTGAAATKEQLEQLVAFAKQNRSMILYDAVYSPYINEERFPKTIYDIPGADEVAIEVHSFSKIAGFTGVRLGWTVVPEKLQFDDGSSVKADWNRLVATLFNGASILSQHGGLAVLEDAGWEQVQKQIAFYKENAQILKRVLVAQGMEVYGGEQAPYLWVRFPGEKSWDIFQRLLEQRHLIVTPGAGFGAMGEEFVRMTAFGHRNSILEAADRLLRK
jgi:LL-diaminopimelate aminotransferase